MQRIIRVITRPMVVTALSCCLLAACGEEKAIEPASPVSIGIVGSKDTIETGDTLHLAAKLLDASGNPMQASPSWSVSNGAVLSVTTAGVVETHAAGVSVVRVEASGLRDSVRITVASIPHALSLNTSPSLFVGDTVIVAPRVTDRIGLETVARVSFRSSDTLVLRVDTLSGGGDAVGDGSATIFATSGTLTAQATVHVSLRSVAAGSARFASIAMGRQHGCALTAAGDAFCFGNNTQGELGNGSVSATSFVGGRTASIPAATAVSGGLKFSSIDGGRGTTCAVTADTHAGYCWGEYSFATTTLARSLPQLAPLPDTVVVASAHGGFNGGNCLLSTTGTPWCFGNDTYKVIGPWDPTTSSEIKTPRALPQSPAFDEIRIGDSHTCGIGHDKLLYCLGAGTQAFGVTSGQSIESPTAVSTPRPFVHVAVSVESTCALDDQGAAWCWGGNNKGTLGNGSMADVLTTSPATVVGNHRFTKIDADNNTVCGLTAAGELWCWGEIGRGLATVSTASLATATPLLFSRDHTFIDFGVSANGVCGLGTDGIIYCALTIPFPFKP